MAQDVTREVTTCIAVHTQSTLQQPIFSYWLVWSYRRDIWPDVAVDSCPISSRCAKEHKRNRIVQSSVLFYGINTNTLCAGTHVDTSYLITFEIRPPRHKLGAAPGKHNSHNDDWWFSNAGEGVRGWIVRWHNGKSQANASERLGWYTS